MKWIKFSEQEPSDWESIIFYRFLRKKIYFAEYMDEGYALVPAQGFLSKSMKVKISYNKDYWMPLPDKPEVKKDE